jgi:hypothetical protein
MHDSTAVQGTCAGGWGVEEKFNTGGSIQPPVCTGAALNCKVSLKGSTLHLYSIQLIDFVYQGF